MRAKINHGQRGLKIETLLKRYEMEYPSEYYDMIVESYENGNFDQCIEEFNAMKEYDQKTFLLNVDQGRIFGEKVRDFIIKSL